MVYHSCIKAKGMIFMKVLLVNGSPNENGCTFTALSEVAARLNEHGVDTEIFQLGKAPVHGCMACGACGKFKKCVIGDDCANTLGEKMTEADGVVIGSPVYYAGANGALCAVLDRVFYAFSRNFAGKPSAAVVSCRRGGASATFDRINKYFTISQMPVVSSAYWNSVHGFCAEDVKKDAEGLQTMRILADNMSWMLKNLSGTSSNSEAKSCFTSFADGK